MNKSKEICKNGHEYTPENTIISRRVKGGEGNKHGKEYNFRECRICKRKRDDLKNRRDRQARRISDEEAKKMNPVPIGNRNSYLYSYANYVCRIYSPERAAKLVLAQNTEACNPPLPEEEVLKIIGSVEQRRYL